eukprot:212282-Amphidinium_carterae.1
MTTTPAISQSTCLLGRHRSITFWRTALAKPIRTVQFTFAVLRMSQSSSIQSSVDKTQWTSI